MSSLILAEELEIAEQRLTYKSGLDLPALAAQFSRAQVDRPGAEKFLAAQLERLKGHYPDLDPRMEPTVSTMMLHCLLVGVVAGRGDGRL